MHNVMYKRITLNGYYVLSVIENTEFVECIKYVWLFNNNNNNEIYNNT